MEAQLGSFRQQRKGFGSRSAKAGREDEARGTPDRWRYLDGTGTVGVIPTVTKPFCGDCDRVRLTAEGQFRTCLFATSEYDLRAMLRSDASDDDIAGEIERAVGAKWAGHAIGKVTFVRPKRSMSQIGG